VAALLMGLVFGGLRVADAESNANQLGHAAQLAKLAGQLTDLINDLQNERDATLPLLRSGSVATAGLTADIKATDADIGGATQAVRQVVNGGFPASITADAQQVLIDISPGTISSLANMLTGTEQEYGAFSNYQTIIGHMLTLVGQISQGIADPGLGSDVQALGALGQAKEDASQQRGLLDYSLTPGIKQTDSQVELTFTIEQQIQLANQGELTSLHAFQDLATPSEIAYYSAAAGASRAKLTDEGVAIDLVQAIITDAADAQAPFVTADGIQLLQVLQRQVNSEPQLGIPAWKPVATSLTGLERVWNAGMSAELDAYERTENLIDVNILARAQQVQSNAQHVALGYLAITVGVLLIVMILALLVAQSVVLPLRRLRAGALTIATVQLPERVRLLADNPESAATTQVAPINITSADEVGQVARAFDQVHSEAVRLAGEQALLQSSFNAMSVNLSRRSQSLIERLALMIDNQEQAEDDPDRLGNLFAMDHLVTRMRRNSENLLLLAGHENPRKWSDPVPLADVARAATSEIEQYNRVTLNIAPGIAVTGQAVSDIVHLLAELIENATIFSPKDSRVLVAAQELPSGGVLVEIVDNGIGVSAGRLTDINWRLDNPPATDVSATRHMGLFAVARLAQRHRVRVRLRPAPQEGLSALVWLPDTLIERTGGYAGGTADWAVQPAAAPRSPAASRHGDGSPSGDGDSTASGSGSGTAASRSGSGWFRGKGAQGSNVSMPPSGIVASMSRMGGIGWSERGHGDGAESGGGQTSAGLPARKPKSSELPTRRPGTSWPGAGGGQPERSPEEARSRLSGFQRGTRRAEGQGGKPGQPPQAGEGTDR
jgi:signal transduction histidine kinase